MIHLLTPYFLIFLPPASFEELKKIAHLRWDFSCLFHFYGTVAVLMSSFLIPNRLELRKKVQFELGTRIDFNEWQDFKMFQILEIKKLILKKKMSPILHYYCNEFHQNFTTAQSHLCRPNCWYTIVLLQFWQMF